MFENWKELVIGGKFLFSVYPNSLVDVVSSKGEVMRGYFKGFDVWGGSINIARPENPRSLIGRPGARTLIAFDKLSVDRLGRITKIGCENRTWHGEVST